MSKRSAEDRLEYAVAKLESWIENLERNAEHYENRNEGQDALRALGCRSSARDFRDALDLLKGE